jgi:hypothetical protein
LLGDGRVGRVVRDQGPGGEIQEQAQAPENHQADEADADQQRIDIQEVAESSGDPADDAVAGSASQEVVGGGSWSFSRHRPDHACQIAARPSVMTPIRP